MICYAADSTITEAVFEDEKCSVPTDELWEEGSPTEQGEIYPEVKVLEGFWCNIGQHFSKGKVED